MQSEEKRSEERVEDMEKDEGVEVNIGKGKESIRNYVKRRKRREIK